MTTFFPVAWAAAAGTVSLFVAVLMGGSPAQAVMPGKCLAPPALVSPIVYWGKCPEDAGGPLNVNALGRDVLVRLPRNRVCHLRLSIIKARNLRITGGKFVYTDTQSSVISIGWSTGAAFIDGVHIDVNAKNADAIRFYRHTGTAVVHNTLIEGVSGGTDIHGDIVHAQDCGPLSQLTLQNVTGYTGYQGLFTPYRVDSGHGTHKLKLDRVNLGYDPEVIVTKPLMLLYLGDKSNVLDQPPDLGTTLSNVFVDGSVRAFPFDRAVYAYPVKDGVGCAAVPAENGVEGLVCEGRPAAGDFAPADLVGLGYDRKALCTVPAAAVAAAAVP